MFDITSRFISVWVAAQISISCVAAQEPTNHPPQSSEEAVVALRQWLAISPDQREPVEAQPFAQSPLTRQDSVLARELIWQDHVQQIKAERAKELDSKLVRINDIEMRYDVVRFEGSDDGDQPLSLFLSMHGGGQAPARVNDSQWRNQVRLGRSYDPKHAIYIAPRAPSDDWNLWHKPEIDPLFDRLIGTLVAVEGVDPNRIYLMGYSAGGDGVYQLAPRMADRFAAASMMAGHPNDASPNGLRNLPFTIHMGEKDGAFRRNEVAAEWKTKLEQLRAADDQGYVHSVEIHAGKGHWMDLQDKAAIEWMQQYERNPLPKKIVWRQSSTKHERFYWLGADPATTASGDEVVAVLDGQQINIERKAGKPKLRIMLSDAMLDLDQPVTITIDGEKIFDGKLPRTIETIFATLAQRGDPELVFDSIFLTSILRDTSDTR